MVPGLMSDPAPSKPRSRLYLYVLLGVVLGGLIGWLMPTLGAGLKPVADGFIALIKMLIGPIIFYTVVLGLAGMSDMRKLGRVGGKAILYFEVVSTFALIIGLLVANLLKPGASFHAQAQAADGKVVGEYAAKAAQMTIPDYILHIIPKTFFDAFTANGDLLQVLLVAILFGAALAAMGEKAKPVTLFLDGSVVADVLYAVPRLVLPYKPKVVVNYCGDNNMTDPVKSDPSVPVKGFSDFVAAVRAELPTTRFIYVSIKPSPSRWAMWAKASEANTLIKTLCAADPLLTYVDIAPALLDDKGQPVESLYVKDRLHPTAEGYARIAAIVKPVVEKVWAAANAK